MERFINVQISEIIRGCKDRDARCQKELYNRFFGLMMSTCYRYCSCSQDAEDIVQDGFIKVFDKIDSFDGNGSFEGWLKRVFVNMALDKIRKQKMQFLSINEGDNEDYLIGSTEQEEMEENELLISIGRENLVKAIQNLSPMYRAVFNLFVIEGFTHGEVAEILEVSEGTSKSNLFKAKKKLRKDIKKLLEAKYAS
ncbi:MAG: RNA polymerase sigma factor [Salibacteraceae bacterium]|nr:RNA polymerase sigma factor [Salibacteraceae bacterium]|tara:strand:+ start:16634 stop:17221 length:588 start_codon:yes stop_codon:yes gene_type:complete